MKPESEYDSAEQDTMIGSALENYEILQKIGEGSIGTIYRGKDLSTEEPVAIKFLTREISSKPQILARFKREIQTAIKMRHPNIVRGYSAGIWEGCIYYYVMEFVDGLTLHDLLSRQTLPEKNAVRIAYQIASALQYIHEFGMVHRDIKPENIMMDAEGEAKLADLGLAKDINDISGLTMVGTIIGTPLYMSPEQAKGAAVVDIRSDIYSLGATLHHAVAGEPPFLGRTAPEVIAKQIEQPPSPVRDLNPALSAGLEYTVLRMMEKDPAARYQTPQDLMADLQLLLEGRGDDRDPDLPWSQTPARPEAEFRFAFYPGEEDFEYALTAVANGLIEKEKMRNILDFQEEMARRAVPLKLAHIAVERGYIEAEANRKVLDAQGRQREMEASKGIGKLAVKKGMATPEQIKEALASQKKLRQEGKYRLLGEILKKNKVLDEERVRRLLALQQHLKFGKEDRDFLALARDHKLISSPVADKAARIQKNELAMNRYRRVGDILVDRKFLSPSARDVIMRAHRRSQLTGEDPGDLLEEKRRGAEGRATEEIPPDDPMLEKYQSFIAGQMKAGKALKKQRKFREAIDAWRAILEVLVRHPDAEKNIRDTENVIENMDAHQDQAEKYFRMAMREWEGILKIDPAYPAAMKALASARRNLGALIGDDDPPTLHSDDPAPHAKKPSERTRVASGPGNEEGGEEDAGASKIKRRLRAAKRNEKQGNVKEARKKYLEVLQDDPNDDEARTALRRLDKARRTSALLGCLVLLLLLGGGAAALYFLVGGDACSRWGLWAGNLFSDFLERLKP